MITTAGTATQTLTHLECSSCGLSVEANALQNLCPNCQAPLLARYDMAAIRRQVTPQEIEARKPGLWRWREMLPVQDTAQQITLGEGDTPLLPAPRLAARLGIEALYIKDEGLNPTGSFKARGMAVAVSRAKQLGARALVTPTAGNAGGAMAAYATVAGLEAHVFMPRDAPLLNQIEVQLYGAQLILVDGLINDAARLAAAAADENGWFDMSTLKEPYRIEGKKTMGLELAQDFAEGGQFKLPEIIVYPTGGGVGLIGMWKAFDELEALGWIDSTRPRLVSVQSDGCAPIVKAFEQGADHSEVWPNASTVASGLRVPAVRGDRLILRALRETHGIAVAVSDDEILEAQWLMARLAGVFCAPEGAATYAGIVRLAEIGWLKPHERVVLYNTGTGLKYPHILPPPA